MQAPIPPLLRRYLSKSRPPHLLPPPHPRPILRKKAPKNPPPPSRRAVAPYEWPLPLTEDGATFSISMMINPQLASYFAGYEDNPSWQEYSKRTGVNFEFQNISAMNIGEQYNLMFASGDYPDIMHSGLSYYSSGADAAVDDGVILDLAPYLEEYAPNYLYWVDKVGGFANITTDEGYRPGFVHILDTPSITRSGPVTRGDWMEP